MHFSWFCPGGVRTPPIWFIVLYFVSLNFNFCFYPCQRSANYIVLKGNLTIFLHDGFSETWTGNLWFHVFWGFKIETKGDFIETRGFSGRHWIPLVSMNITFLSHFLNTPKYVNTTDFLSKFNWIPSYKIKKICEVLFDISF